ncbi:hypothetical protein Nepgr_008716 [Nepenthes gracilis]|uniref:BRO1 domain-containing protein n=1 Tax=Nepenthes gracilis TaxID=150966 RepID=A0AAD3SA57_NEPGR|nr:hypothetical protein Nepgr_008716 [Nepenthes gracilis]
MGCTSSILQKKKKMTIPEVVVFVPTVPIPQPSDLERPLKGLVPRHLIDRLSMLRSQITLVAEDTGGAAIGDLKHALEEYLSLILGLTKKEYGLEELVKFKWRYLDDKRQETCISNSWFDILYVIYMLAILTLSEADSLLIPRGYSASSERMVSSDSQRDAVELLLKASGYLEFCVKNVLAQLAPDIKKKLPKDMQEGPLEALSIQALGQGTELQLGLAVENQKATLSVKRRLACEQLTYFSQAHHSLSGGDTNEDDINKHSLFIRWKYLEAKAAAYYYHGLILDKGNEPSCHVSALCCFLAAQELLSKGKKACVSFCLAAPVTRAPPLWGVTKYLHQKIPDMASRRTQMYGRLLHHDKRLHELPVLPEFQLSLRPDEYELPATDAAWNRDNWAFLGQPLKDHQNDSGDDMAK